MVQAIIKLGKYQDRVLTMVKGQYGFKNKSDAINFLIKKFSEDHYEPKIRPDFVEKFTKDIKKASLKKFDSVDQLRELVNNENKHRSKTPQKLAKLSSKDPALYENVLKKISEIIQHPNPNHYKNLRKPLQKYKRVHITSSFVLLFEIKTKEHLINFYKFEHRDNVYK